jgi:hypothetical protein
MRYLRAAIFVLADCQHAHCRRRVLGTRWRFAAGARRRVTGQHVLVVKDHISRSQLAMKRLPSLYRTYQDPLVKRAIPVQSG